MTTLDLKKENEKFRNLSPAKQRVAIAKDAIKQIKLEKYLAECGTYVMQLGSRVNYNQTNLLNQKFTCKCCALGAAAVSVIRKNNESDSPDLQIMQTVWQFFSCAVAYDMEQAFEGWGGGGHAWIAKYPNHTKRLLAVFHNIVRNKGEFKIRKP